MSTDWAVVFATCVGPILAVWASDWREARRRKRERREDLVFTLMSTRRTIQSPEHVQALNRIEVVFPERRYPKVIDSWRQYHRHLSDREAVQRNEATWEERRSDLFAYLVDAAARACGYEFPMDSIRNAAYLPSGVATEAAQLAELRQHFLNLMRAAAAAGQQQPQPLAAVAVQGANGPETRANSGANPVRIERQ